jgi:Cys-tRNA(Pro)/Cys-tRNA(Cys) deacylase
LFVAQAKTNAMRILEQKKIAYTAMEYDTSDGLLDGVSVAKKIGRDAPSVFKTLVARGASKAVYISSCPSPGSFRSKPRRPRWGKSPSRWPP